MATDKKSLFGNSQNFEEEVYEALKKEGFHLKKTDEEILAFVNSFGETKIELPESLSDPDKLFDEMSKKVWGRKDERVFAGENTLSLAAHGQRSKELPREIIELMKGGT